MPRSNWLEIAQKDWAHSRSSEGMWTAEQQERIYNACVRHQLPYPKKELTFREAQNFLQAMQKRSFR